MTPKKGKAAFAACAAGLAVLAVWTTTHAADDPPTPETSDTVSSDVTLPAPPPEPEPAPTPTRDTSQATRLYPAPLVKVQSAADTAAAFIANYHTTKPGMSGQQWVQTWISATDGNDPFTHANPSTDPLPAGLQQHVKVTGVQAVSVNTSGAQFVVSLTINGSDRRSYAVSVGSVNGSTGWRVLGASDDLRPEPEVP